MHIKEGNSLLRKMKTKTTMRFSLIVTVKINHQLDNTLMDEGMQIIDC